MKSDFSRKTFCKGTTCTVYRTRSATLPLSEPLPTTTTGHYTICCKKSQSCAPEDGQKFALNMLSWSWRSANFYCCISLVFYITLPTVMMHGQTQVKFTFYKFERKVSRTFVGSEPGLHKFMKIVFLGIQSCGDQSFMFKIIHSLEYVLINMWFKMCLYLSPQTGHASTKSCVSPTSITPARFPSKRYVMESTIVGFCFILSC